MKDNNTCAKAISTLKLDDILGLWDNDEYTLVITDKAVSLQKKIEDRTNLSEPIIWKHIVSTEEKIHFNTIRLSNSIYIHMLFDNCDDDICIYYNQMKILLRRVKLINQFKFYINNENTKQVIAIRYNSPWEYAALVEFNLFEIKRIFSGSKEEEKSEIIRYNLELSDFSNKWRLIDFEHFFPKHLQKDIIKELKMKL